MQKSIGPLAAEQQFFSSLIGGDVGAWDRILGDDFLPIDVMRGPEVEQPDLLRYWGQVSSNSRPFSLWNLRFASMGLRRWLPVALK